MTYNSATPISNSRSMTCSRVASRSTRAGRTCAARLGRLQHKVRTLLEPTGLLEVSRDGNRLVAAGQEGTLRVWNFEAGQQCFLREPVTHMTLLSLSGDGRRMFLATGDTIKMWDLQKGTGPIALHGHTEEIESLAPSEDGKRLVSRSGSDNTIKVWDVDSAKAIRTLSSTAPLDLLNKDGTCLIWRFGDAVKVVDLETGKETHTLSGHTKEVECVVLSGDGKRLFAGGSDQIKVWDLDTGELLRTRVQPGCVLSLAQTADGKRLISGNADHTIEVWDLETDQVTCLRGHLGDVGTLAVSADGKRLLSGGGFFSGENALKLWDLTTGQELLRLPGHPSGVARLALSADARRLVSAGRDGAVNIWDLDESAR